MMRQINTESELTLILDFEDKDIKVITIVSHDQKVK